MRGVAQPCWVSGPDRRVRFLNREAEALLGMRAEDSIGRPCHEVVAGRAIDGRPFCGAACAVTCAVARGEAVRPVEVHVGPHGPNARWARMTVIAVPSGGPQPWLVHLASDVGRERRAESYLERVARRSDAIREQLPPSALRPLTAREREILDLLCEDEELGRVAHRLGISRTTARNHVQRLLAALGAHSVAEAVAMRLLG